MLLRSSSLGRVALVLSALAVVIPSSATAAEPPAPSPEQVDVAALLRDPAALVGWVETHQAEVAAARARLAEARADTDASRLFPNPALDASVGNYPLGRTTPPGLSFSDTAVVDVGLTQTFELGKRGPRIASAELRQKASAEDALGVLLDRAQSARDALAKVAWARERVAVLDDSLAAARKALELERTRVQQGDMSGNDFHRLELEDVTVEAEVTRAHAEYDGAVAECEGELQATCSAGAGWDTALDAVLLPEKRPSIDAALAGRPELRSLELQRQSADRDAVLARRRAIPDVDVRLGYTQSQFTISGDNPRVLGLSLRVPIPAFDHGQADEARAIARAHELEAEARGVGMTARAALTGLDRREQALQATLARLEGEALPKSKAVLASTETALHQGQVSLTDLLLARRTHIALQLSVLDLRYELFQVRNDLRRGLALDAPLAHVTPE